MLSHVILEIVCFFDLDHNSTVTMPAYCHNGTDNPGIHCILNQCPLMGVTDAPYELAFSHANGEINISDESSWVGFGGDMEPAGISEDTRNRLICLWREISKRKIKEAYAEYIEQMGKYVDRHVKID